MGVDGRMPWVGLIGCGCGCALVKDPHFHLRALFPTFAPRQLVCLMEAVIGHVDRAFLRAKFKPIAEVLTTLLKTNLDHEMTGACESCIRTAALAPLLRS